MKILVISAQIFYTSIESKTVAHLDYSCIIVATKMVVYFRYFSIIIATKIVANLNYLIKIYLN